MGEGLAAAGKMTSPVTAAIDREYLRRLIPARTRSGLDTGRELRDQYLEQADVRRIPSLAIETAISKREWVSQGGADRNTLIDKMHLTAALPYTDDDLPPFSAQSIIRHLPNLSAPLPIPKEGRLGARREP